MKRDKFSVFNFLSLPGQSEPSPKSLPPAPPDDPKTAKGHLFTYAISIEYVVYNSFIGILLVAEWIRNAPK